MPLSRRNWTTYNYAALWVSMAHCIPTYMLASGLMASGMNWSQALVHDPARQHDRPGPDPAELAPGHEVRHSVPGVRARRLRHARLERAGADARARRLRLVRHPGVDRRGSAAHVLQDRSFPGWPTLLGAGFGGHTTTEWLSFLLFWGLNIFIIYRGMDLLRAGGELGGAVRAGDDRRAAVVGGLAGQRPRAAARAAGQVPHVRASSGRCSCRR